ncbi:MAG: hypothetical protein IKU03_04305, partial [Bacteroidales bacterium]|nr:hypothetical protein [Bacteroidales bacterium]
YTFSAKERDSETGLSYFGSRYYSSDLSIWLSVDPMSDKYASLSPYNYCANNPVKLVDPNGEEIYVGEDYCYRDGSLYHKGTDNVYTPKEGSFEEKALKSLNQLRSSNQGGELLDEFEGNTGKDVNIVNAIFRKGDKNNQSGTDEVTYDASTRNFLSVTIYWNPEGMPLSTTVGMRKNGTTDLGHELSHAFDMANNIPNNRTFDNAPEGEWRAVYRENMIRQELGMPYRRGYRCNLVDKGTGETTPYFTHMLRSGTPFLPTKL